jgi:DNA-binding NtrC family response regulator
LKNAMERMAVMAPDTVLTPDLLPGEIMRGQGPGAGPTFDDDGILPLRDAEKEFRKQHLRRALAVTEGNQTRAAELLGIQRSSLNRQMKELGLREEDAPV